MKREIPNKAFDYIREVLHSGILSSRYGDMAHRFEQAFAEKKGANFAIAVNSGTSALFVALKACGIGPGDEVIVPALGPTMTAAAVTHCGALPVFADIDPETYCIAPNSFRSGTVTTSTKAILPVHVFGNSCQMGEIVEIAQYRKHYLRGMRLVPRKPIFVIEDCAQAIGLGGQGDIACYSFEQSKHICCGDGGMATTNDPELAKKMRQWSDGGVTCMNALDGRWNGRVEFDCPGYNLRMPEIVAAIGMAQMEQFDERPRHFTKYIENEQDKFKMAFITYGVEHNRGPWEKLVYQHKIFGAQKGLCPVAEKIHPDLFVFPQSEKNLVEKVMEHVKSTP